MKRREPSVLDRNLGALLRRAYRPVLPTPHFRARLEAELRRRLRPSTEDPGTGWTGVDRLRRPAALAAAVLLALLAGWIASTRPSGERSFDAPQVLLARGEVALRDAPVGSWRGLAETERRSGVDIQGRFLEVATPGGVGLELRLPDGGSIHARPASELRIERGARTALELGAGGADLRLAGEGRWEVRSRHGRLDLEAGQLELAHARPERRPAGGGGDAAGEALRARLVEGVAWLVAEDGRAALPPGRTCWIRDGVLLGSGVDGAREPAPDPGAGRRPVEGTAASGAVADGGGPGLGDPQRGVLRGLLQGAGGDPVGPFRIALLRTVALPQISEPEVYAFDDLGGVFAIDGLRPGQYTVFALAPGHAVCRVDAAGVRAGQATELRPLRLERGANVRGFVLDAQTDLPIEGAIVLSERDAPYQVLETAPSEPPPLLTAAVRTDERGAFALEGLAPGRQVLRASRPGHAPAWIAAFDVEDGELLEGMVFRLGPGGTVSGRVSRDDGTPWADTFIVASLVDYQATHPCMTFGSAQTDHAGAFEIGDLAPGGYAIVHIDPMQRGALPTVVPTQVHAGAVTRVLIPRPSGARLAGTVTGPDGAPLANYNLFVEHEGDGVDPRLGWQSTRTGDDGRYEFLGLEQGPYAVYVGWAVDRDFVFHDRIVLRDGEDRPYDVHVGAASFGGVVRAAADGAPLALAVTILERLDTASGQPVFAGKGMTDPEGRYAFQFLPPGRYRVWAHASQSGLAAVRAEVELLAAPLGEPVDLELVPGATLRVRVRDGDGRPLGGVQLRFLDASGACFDPTWLPATDPRGTFEASGFGSGVWHVEAVLGERSATTRCELEVGTSTEVELVLDPPR